MARFTGPVTGTGSGSALNYVQVAGQQVTVSSAPTSIINLDITTTGKPVQISVTGEGANASAGSWVKMNLFRGNTAIGNEIQIEASAVSENVPYAINFIDNVQAGTYNYSIRVTSKASGNWVFGEVAGPVMNAVELTGFKGDTGAQGPQGEPGAQGEAGTDATGGLVFLGNYISGNGYIADIAVVRGSDDNLYIAKDSGGLQDPVGNTAQWDIFSYGYGNGGTGGDLVIPFIMKDENGNDLLGFEKGGTGVTRINALQDDLALRSSNDIILYPGDDGPGNVYIGWGDATYTPNATNRVATIADIQSANIADFVFTDDSEETGRSIISLPGDKGMTIQAGADSDLYLTAGDDLYIETLGEGDDIHINAADDIRFSSANDSVENSTIHYWRMDSDGEFHLPGAGYISNPIDSSGDGSGNDTLRLIPDDDVLYNNNGDQYIIIDPTGSNHIHVRAGGTQDASTAHLILGGERNNVVVSDSVRSVGITTRPAQIINSYTNQSDTSDSNFVTAMPANIDTGYTVNVGGTDYTVSGTILNYPSEGLIQVTVPEATFDVDGSYTFVYEQPWDNFWQFTSNGVFTGPSMGAIKVEGIANSGAGNDLYIYTNDADININATDNIASINAQNVNLNANDNVTINTLGGDRTWNFTDSGVLYGPAEDLHLEVAGVKGENGHPTMFIGPDSVVFDGNNGEFLNDPNVASNQIATVGDIATAQNNSFAEVPYTVNGGSLGTQPTFNGAPLFAGSYTKTGNLVHFRVNVTMSNITNFGSGQYYVSIPFTSEYDVYVRNGQLKHSSGDMYSVSGHALAGSNELRLYTTASNGKEVAFTSSSPVGLNTTCDFHIFGSYFSTPS